MVGLLSKCFVRVRLGFRKLLRLLSGTNETILDVLWFRKLLRLLSGTNEGFRKLLRLLSGTNETILVKTRVPETA